MHPLHIVIVRRGAFDFLVYGYHLSGGVIYLGCVVCTRIAGVDFGCYAVFFNYDSCVVYR